MGWNNVFYSGILISGILLTIIIVIMVIPEFASLGILNTATSNALISTQTATIDLLPPLAIVAVCGIVLSFILGRR